MAGDWIKMRTWLRKDPRVASIADYLALQRPFMNWLTDPVQRTCDESVYEHITSDVTRAITVASLLEIWGVARERGDRVGDDLIVKHCDLTTLDDICGTPCLGEALEFVDWAVEEEHKDEKSRTFHCVRFPNFFEETEPPHEKYRRQHAEAQARYRQKVTSQSNPHSDITSDITVTHREEKRREEKIEVQERVALLAPSRTEPGPKPKVNDHINGNGHPATRATRLPCDWTLPDEWKEWTILAHHLDPQKVVRISTDFRDYWIAKPGKDGCKLDWQATWRRWVRKECGGV